MHSPGVIFIRTERCLPSLKNLRNDLQTICFSVSRKACLHVELSCSGPFTRRLFRIADRFYCFILVLSSTFGTPWKYFHISVVLTEKQLNEQLALPNSHIFLESRHWSNQLVGTWKTDVFFPSIKNYTQRP